MILKDLCSIANKGASYPLFLWLADYQKSSQKAIPLLKKIEPKIIDKTIAKTNLNKLIELLKQKEPKALSLSKLLSYLASILSDFQTANQKELVINFKQNCADFEKISQQENIFAQKRSLLKKSLSLKKQQEYDLRLFNYEGMTYCLEFYLALYKTIQDANTDEEKWHYINSPEIDLGSGNVPGLKADFQSDEALEKFIYCILNDNVRELLVESFFSAKYIFNHSRSLEVINRAFKHYILTLFQAFQTMGIHQLASYFFTPYGNKPMLNNIKL